MISIRTQFYRVTFLISTLFISLFAITAFAETIYTCAHKTTGKLRQVSGPGECHIKRERELSWDDGDGLRVLINSLAGRVTALEEAVGLINEPPSVNAGSDQSILLSSSVYLEGSASDDGILDPLTTTWTHVSGPGTASFADASALITSVSFDQVGDHILRLTASDGIIDVYDEVLVKVIPDNSPPVVDAGVDQTVTGSWSDDGIWLKCETTVSGTASDDGLPEPLYVEWPDLSDAQIFYISYEDNNSLVTQATIYVHGTQTFPYPVVLTLTASDGFHSVSDTVEINCQAP